MQNWVQTPMNNHKSIGGTENLRRAVNLNHFISQDGKGADSELGGKSKQGTNDQQK